MNILSDIGINLLVALIGFGFGWVWQRAREAIRFRGARRFWKPFLKEKTLVVIPRVFRSEREQIGTVRVGTANSIMELNAYFRILGTDNINIAYTDYSLEGDSLKSNLILIGGPLAHAITKEVLARINSALQFKETAPATGGLYNSETGKFYETIFRDHLSENNLKEVSKDYAMILKTVNPFDKSKLVLLIAGNFDYGTWAGVRFTMSKEFIENKLVTSGKPIEALIETDILRGSPQSIRLVFLQELKQ
jgi:S-layer family protein